VFAFQNSDRQHSWFEGKIGRQHQQIGIVPESFGTREADAMFGEIGCAFDWIEFEPARLHGES